MPCVEGFGDVGGGELDDHLFCAGFGVGGVAETKVWVETVVLAHAEDGGDDEVGERDGFEEELYECCRDCGLFDEW